MAAEFLRAHDRALLVDLRLPPLLRPRPVAVLLCPPFGEEAVRAHRALRVLAQRIEAAGYAAMRLDYSGTGDSSGDSADARIADWVEDIAAAAQALRARSGSARVVLVGLRLGATLAAQAARDPRVRAAHLLLWDPVVDGAAYLQDLGRTHRAYLQEDTGRAQPDTGAPPTESLGMPLSDDLRAGIAALDLAALPPATPLCTVLRTRPSPELARLELAWSAGPVPAHWIDVDAPGAWDSDAALNAAVVPINELLAIVARLQACHP